MRCERSFGPGSLAGSEPGFVLGNASASRTALRLSVGSAPREGESVITTSAPLSSSPSEVPGRVSDEKPADGVEIVRDGAGVPHVFATGPDEQTIDLWREFIDNSTKTRRFQPNQDTLVLDGIPRNEHQAEMLKDTLEVVSVFYLRCTHVDQLVERLQRRALKENRLDDANMDVIRNRQKTYERESKPVLNFYGNKLLHRINADQTPAKVLFDILRHVVKV